ncbi:MAG: hypothetical protein KKE44_08540 [Proteobacteria bacterium]|nr:hypothetical protein [Pseudomonadota bacterium]MBU1582775.1 hypothetical protein [Pseudomonadota bacterium]MBU2455942.1 hypothetical protein [Pseudomonadota bacterium]MBU2631912.1 hypothetical protein [Pseudomonadota bacterium]
MNGYLPNKNLVFFNPGIPGVVFTHAANYYITVEQLLRIQERLVQKTANPVIYIEDHRAKKRISQRIRLHKAV